jgi:hypothetical protein
MKIGLPEKIILFLFILGVLLGFIALLLQNEILNQRIITAIYAQSQIEIETEIEYSPSCQGNC